MKKHIIAVGALQIGLGAVGVLVAAIVLVVLLGSGLLAVWTEGEALPLVILAPIAVLVALFVAVLTVPKIVGGIGLLKGKPWARMLVLVMAAIGLLNIPVGTAVGIYTFWVLTQDEANELLS